MTAHSLSANHPPRPEIFNVKSRGQVFTPTDVVQHMLGLRRNHHRVLEPSCGNGAFSSQLPGCVAIEMDPAICPDYARCADFFSYPTTEKFETIIGNPPYVRYQSIEAGTRALLPNTGFDERSNLYLFFIHKCIEHLTDGGELIFITPRDFLRATSARHLNSWLHDQGTFTHMEETGDRRIFQGFTPNCVIFRYVKGHLGHVTDDGRTQTLHDGQLFFNTPDGSGEVVKLGELFSVKVGAVSGADSVFTHPDGNVEFVCSHTRTSGKTKRMFYNVYAPALEPHKQQLIERRIRHFDEKNWWQWGRGYPDTDALRIYVNAKTRVKNPFFVHSATAYDGSVLALFPKAPALADARDWAAMLNTIDWEALGFVCNGRFLFSQRALEACPLPASALQRLREGRSAENKRAVIHLAGDTALTKENLHADPCHFFHPGSASGACRRNLSGPAGHHLRGP